MPALAYVANNGSNNVSVIDVNPFPFSPTFDTQIDLIPLRGTGPTIIAITPDITRAYVTDRNSSQVSMIVIRILPVPPSIPRSL
jgi:DNA-binding beta-propeller fold protein YncE